MAKIDDLFKLMFDQDASDLHLSSGSPPFLRKHGKMIAQEGSELSNEDVQALVFEILNDKQKRLFIDNWELDCSYTMDIARFRVNVFMQRKGMGAVFRMIPSVIKTAQELGLPQEMLNMIGAHRGLICVTGPTGSGKSTTLAALINQINETSNSHIITIEDPIEFVHQNKLSLINQREVSSHTKSFANALKASLREDPDIILLGEMRDLETIGLALTAAETGHLVFGTLHTSSAAKTVDRIIDVFPEERQAQVRVQLSESLRGVISQSLLPRIDKPGRIAAHEILFNTKAVANLIREGKTFQIPSTMQVTRAHGNITLESSLDALVQKGYINKEMVASLLGRSSEEHAKIEAQAAARNMPVQAPPPTGAAAAAAAAQAGLGNLANRFKKTS